MSIKLKKNWFIIFFSIVLFSLINISSARAGCIITVQYKYGCPRSGAVVRTTLGDEFADTDENGLTSCDSLSPGHYYVYAKWPPDTLFAGPVDLDVDSDGNGFTTIQKDSDYPDGTESCGDGECDGYQYCVVGTPNYIECKHSDQTPIWNLHCDVKKCCKCNGGTIANPKENYNAALSSDCDICWACSALDTCTAYTGNNGNECYEECTYCSEGSCLNRDKCDKTECPIMSGEQTYCDSGGGSCIKPNDNTQSGENVCEACISGGQHDFDHESWWLNWDAGTTLHCCQNDPNEYFKTNGGQQGCCDKSSDCLDSNGICRTEYPKEVTCHDDIDNDCDNLIDYDDPDCPPESSNLVEPPDPSLYNPSATYTFSIDWIDKYGVDEVILEMDGIKYSSKDSPSYIIKTGNTYSMTFATCISGGSSGGGGGGGGSKPMFVTCSMDPITPWIELFKFLTGGIVRAAATPCLGIGTHNYKWYAKDTSGNEASTISYTFTIYRIDPVFIDIISPENKTYSSSSVDVKYIVSSPFEISWIGYSLDNKPNVTLTGNTSVNMAEGSHNIMFYANTTYSVMNSSDRIYFTVSLPKPDLIVEDIWTSGSKIYYRIKNQGNVNAGYSYSKLYIDDYYKTYDYVPSLVASYSSNEYFSYTWSCSGSSDSIKVCADGYGYVSESKENNNCMTKTFTCPVLSCSCTGWILTGECCAGNKGFQTRTCNPTGCAAESRCYGFCIEMY
jgi:hypothetical protein